MLLATPLLLMPNSCLCRPFLDSNRLQKGNACSCMLEEPQQRPYRRQAKRLRRCASRRGPGLQIHCQLRADYAATACDSSVLRRPLKEELQPEDVKNVFDFPRNLHEK